MPKEKFPENVKRWLTNEEVAQLLVAAESCQEWATDEVRQLPPNGSVFLYRKGAKCNYRCDGFCWRKRRHAQKVREDHMKLKIDGVERISANYAHSALVPTFHRRAYSLISNPDLILLHYFNQPCNCEIQMKTMSLIIENVKTQLGGGISKQEIENQLISIFSVDDSCKSRLEAAVQTLLNEIQLGVTHSIINLMEIAAENSVGGRPLAGASIADGEDFFYATKNRQQKRNFRLRHEDSVQSDCLPDESAVGVETAENLAVRGSDLKLGRSGGHRDSAYSSCNDMHDANDDMFCLSSYEQLVANCKHLVQLHSPSPSSASSASSDVSLLGKSFTVSEELNLGLSADEVNRTLAANLNESASESMHVVNGTEFDSAAEDELLGLLHVEEQREPDVDEAEMRQDRSSLNTPFFAPKHSAADGLNFVKETIRDFSPDWCYQSGGTKLLITGDWSESFSYVVIFDQSIYVPAQLLQPGVLKAFCPPHAPGKASLAVKCLNTGQQSPPVKFEFRPAPLSLGPNGSNSEMSMFMINNDEELKSGLIGRLNRICCKLLGIPMENLQLPNAINISIRSPISAFESAMIAVVDLIRQHNLNQSIGVESEQNGMILIHFVAALGLVNLFDDLLDWKDDSNLESLNDELDPLKRDANGRTALMWACLCNRMEMGRHLVAYCRDAMLAVDNARHLPLVVVYEAGRYEFARHLLHDFCQLSGTPQCEDSAIWVLTGGKYDARQLEAAPFSIRNPNHHRSIEKQKSADIGFEAEPMAKGPFKRASFSAGDRRSNFAPHIDMPMDVEFGSTEGMNDQLLCHPEVAREQIASLAQQIIDALPERIKWEQDSNTIPFCPRENSAKSNKLPPAETLLPRRSPLSAPNSSIDELFQPFMDYRSHLADYQSPTPDLLSPTSSNCLAPSPSAFSCNTELSYANELLSCAIGFDSPPDSPTVSPEKLGEFFNASRSTSRGLLEDFQDLTLNDREQRELYVAAKVIQNAYRQYKARRQQGIQMGNYQLPAVSTEHTEMERRAAITIQSYYRRYKQYCYFKKLHNAAVLIQKHFRVYRNKQLKYSQKQSLAALDAATLINEAVNAGATVAAFDGNANADRNRVQVTAEELLLWRQQLAAIRIQHAYRGHYMRKRHAAARKIQRFMRESRQKLRKVRESNGFCGQASPAAILQQADLQRNYLTGSLISTVD